MNPDDIKEPKMKMFSVSICVSIEAEDEDRAIVEFYERMNECAFDRRSIEIEEDDFE